MSNQKTESTFIDYEGVVIRKADISTVRVVNRVTHYNVEIILNSKLKIRGKDSEIEEATKAKEMILKSLSGNDYKDKIDVIP